MCVMFYEQHWKKKKWHLKEMHEKVKKRSKPIKIDPSQQKLTQKKENYPKTRSNLGTALRQRIKEKSLPTDLKLLH